MLFYEMGDSMHCWKILEYSYPFLVAFGISHCFVIYLYVFNRWYTEYRGPVGVLGVMLHPCTLEYDSAD